MLADGQLSDLFFNYQHDTYDALPWSDCLGYSGPSQADIAAAILVDAKDFAECYPEIMNDHDAQWLADNFMRRL